jgi:hypothetical protein
MRSHDATLATAMTPMVRGSLALSSALAALFVLTGSAHAQIAIRVVTVERVRVDGSLRDWRGVSWTTVGEGTDASMRFALGHDQAGLYVAAEVSDERLVRSVRPGAREDAVILTLAASGARARAVDVYLFAGVPGRSAASAASGPVGGTRLAPVRGAQVVEGPLSRGAGYVLEAFLPFSALPGGAAGWRRLRGSMRLRDVDLESRPEVESEPALVAVDPRNLASLLPLSPQGGAGGVLEDFAASQNLVGARATHELSGNVYGDERAESVVLVGGFLLVSGPGYRDGRGYGYERLPVGDARDVRSAELVDLTNDGRAELVLVLRQRNAQGERDLWQVMDLTGEAPRAVFAIEVRKAVGSTSVEAQVRIRGARGAAPTLEVRPHRAQGLAAATYRESPATDAEPMLLPWGPVAERTYRWSGRSFERTGERPNPRYRPPEPPSPGPTPAAPAAEVPPQAPSEDELLAAFQRQRGIPAGTRPRPRLRANLVGGSEPETLAVFGRQLVAFGPNIRGGASWLFYELPAASDADVLSVEVADVTSDGRAEVLVRVRQTFGDVQREVLLVHQLTDSGFPRLLQVEVARQLGSQRIQNQVRTAGGRLEIQPGRATGWTQETYRFARDPNDDAGPLLLPWADPPQRYRLRGGRLQAQ